jgi:hypothetical protein
MIPAGVCLLELLRFYAEVYIRITKELFDLKVCAQIEEADGGLTPELKSGIEGHLEITKRCCEKIGLQVSAIHADELLLALKIGTLSSRDIEPLHKNIERELSCRFYVGISEDRKAAFCESLKGWEDITKKFSAATEDIEEMNKCYALCRYPAAVFHSLLVLEHGLVALGRLVGTTDPKEGWDASCKKLADIVKAGRTANTTGLNFEVLEQLNTCIQVIKLAWRNKVNHAVGKPIVMHGGFAPYVAEEIISATRGFMRRLAEVMS